MILIVDASIALSWFVEQPLSRHALHLVAAHSPLYAPDVFLTETACAAWRLAQQGAIAPAQAAGIADAVTEGVPAIFASGPYLGGAMQLALALQHPLPGCLYLACARELGGRVITTDARILAAVKGTEADPFICHLRDVVPAL